MTVPAHRDWLLLGILVTGNLLVWGDRLITAALPVRFDFEAFENRVRRAWNKTPLVNRPFEPNPMIPKSHLHLRAAAEDDLLYSVYAGHHPRLGILEPEPHDPRLCYQMLGYRVLTEPREMVLEDDGQRHAVHRIEVSRRNPDGSRLQLTTYYWHQLAGRMPVADAGMPGPWTQARIRYLEGRSDLVWVRVELRGLGRALDAPLRDRLLALMRAAAVAMGRP